MSKKITVAALGPDIIRERLLGSKALAFVRSFWRKELDRVLPEQPDLIVLPEACDRLMGQSIPERLEYYTERGELMLDVFRDIARNNHCWIAYSAVMPAGDGTFRNATMLIDRSGRVAGTYHKNFPMINETTEQHILCGRAETVIETEFGKTGMAICFDLNFHDLLERYAAHRPKLMLFSSMYHGGLMQNYWAYHCRSYFIAAVTANECAVVNPLGEKIAHSSNYFPFVTAEINLDYQVVHLDYHWEKLELAKKKYGRGVNIFDPGRLGSVLLASEMPDVSSADILKEFDIMPWDEYYQLALNHRCGPCHLEPL